MDNEMDDKRVTAIVPTYNEEERIGRVLDTLTTYPHLKEVIVIDDGSTDDTGAIAKKYPVNYVKNEVNGGKGAAMDLGVKLAKGDIIFFCDADISGLTHKMIDEIITPVVNGDVEMFIAMRNRKIYLLRFFLIFVPLLGGERALTKRLWQNLPSEYKDHFKIEAALNFYARYYYKGLDFKVFQGLSQTIKEKKYGLRDGMKQRIGMMLDIFKSELSLRKANLPKDIKHRHKFLMQLSANTFSFMVGIIILVIAYVGPFRFLLKIFGEELREDPNAPMVHFLLRIITKISVDMLLVIGFIIVGLNLMFLVFNIRKYLKLKRIRGYM